MSFEKKKSERQQMWFYRKNIYLEERRCKRCWGSSDLLHKIRYLIEIAKLQAAPSFCLRPWQTPPLMEEHTSPDWGSSTFLTTSEVESVTITSPQLSCGARISKKKKKVSEFFLKPSVTEQWQTDEWHVQMVHYWHYLEASGRRMTTSREDFNTLSHFHFNTFLVFKKWN